MSKLKEQDVYKEQNTDTEMIPNMTISVSEINVSVKEGQVYKSKILLESHNRVPIVGVIASTSDKVGLEVSKLEGVRQEIPFYFKGKLAVAGTEYSGKFIIISNGGEYTIPYTFTVVPKSIETSIGQISELDQFMELYEKEAEEAANTFFLPEFPEIFLRGDESLKELYHGMMKGRSKSVIMEEFLVAAGLKKAVTISVDEDRLTIEQGKDNAQLTLHLSEKGYVEGKIYGQKGLLTLSVDSFHGRDFRDGILTVEISKNPKAHTGSDIVVIETISQHLEVMVEWWDVQKEPSSEREALNRAKHQRAELMHNYLYFRTGSIEFEDFDEESVHTLEDLYVLTKNPEWKLYYFHFLLMEGKKQEAEQELKELEKIYSEGGFDALCRHYYLYLRAMYYKTSAAISEAVVAIRNFYESSNYKAEAFWMLIYLDREYVYNKRLQYDTIKQLFEEGGNSCLLYFEACDILNDNPEFMEELGKFEIAIFRWGVRYGYISLSLAYQFARLSLKLKYYNRSIFYIAEKLYQVEPDERFLQVICSLLIKGNRTQTQYHGYFRQAVESNLKIIGINEFYVRSMDFTEYEIIPQRVLIYFTYSNSLDSKEKAYLYTNIIKNRSYYEEVFGAYYAKMKPFVEDELLKGRMNEHLAFLYTHFQKEILEKPDNAKAVCDIIFYQKLTCNVPGIIGVYATCPETGEEKYYPLSDGCCYVEIYNRRTRLYFVDAREHRYLSNIEYQLHPFLELSQFPKEWIRLNLANHKLLLHLSDKTDGQLSREDLPILKKLVDNQAYQEWLSQRALACILTWYENHQEKEELMRWLDRADYSKVPVSFRKQLMDYYLEVGKVEEAFFGVELYGGSMLGMAKRLRLASFGIDYYHGEYDETTLKLAYSAFSGKKYNKDTLTYLMNYLDSTLDDLILLFQRAKKFELSTEGIEEKILRQAILVGSMSPDVFPIFEAYYETHGSGSTTTNYLNYISRKGISGELTLPEKFYEIIGNEILGGRITDKISQTDFLYYFAGVKEKEEPVIQAAQFVIEHFLKEEYYLPVFHAYEEWVDLPIEYEELTFLTYDGMRGSDAALYYTVDDDTSETRRDLKEVLPGRYVCFMHFFQNDQVNYRLEVDGTVIKGEDKLKFETFEYHLGDSRFFLLNHLDSEEAAMEDLDDYVVKAFFTDQKMQLL